MRRTAEIVAHHVAAFDAHERGDLVLLLGVANIVGGGGEDEIVGMLAHRFADGVDLIEGLLHGGAGRVILPLIQMEKKMAVRPPSRMRGTSMLPSACANGDIEIADRGAVAWCRRGCR